MKYFKNLYKIQESFFTPYIISSFVPVLSQFLFFMASLVKNDEYSNIFNSLGQMLLNIISYIFVVFFVYNTTKNEKFIKSLFSGFGLLIINTICLGNGKGFLPLIFSILFALICIKCFNKFEIYFSFIIIACFSLLIGVLLFELNDIYYSFLNNVSKNISNKSLLSPILFAVLKDIFDFFGISDFKELFYFKEYGGISVTSQGFIVGAKNLFEKGINSKYISTYLSGQVFEMFSVTGFFLALLANYKKELKIVAIFVLSSALLSGNFTIMMLFLFFENPIYLAVFFGLSAMSYLCSYLLDLNVGFLFDGGIVELLLNINKPVYYVAVGIVFVTIGYFCIRYCYNRYGESYLSKIYIPDSLKGFVLSLGGVENIIKITDEYSAEVRNPLLVDCIKINCEINENIITLKDKRIKELMEYLQ